MSTTRHRPPGYLHHKPTGQARVRINGRDFYLGTYGTPESKEHYHRLLAEHAAGSPLTPPAQATATPGYAIIDLLAHYWRFAEQGPKRCQGPKRAEKVSGTIVYKIWSLPEAAHYSFLTPFLPRDFPIGPLVWQQLAIMIVNVAVTSSEAA